MRVYKEEYCFAVRGVLPQLIPEATKEGTDANFDRAAFIVNRKRAEVPRCPSDAEPLAESCIKKGVLCVSGGKSSPTKVCNADLGRCPKCGELVLYNFQYPASARDAQTIKSTVESSEFNGEPVLYEEEPKEKICLKYWLKPVNKELPQNVSNEAFQMNKLWNEFVAIGEKFRETYQSILSEDASVADLRAKLSDINERSKKARAARNNARMKHKTKASAEIEPYIDDMRTIGNEKKEITAALNIAKNNAKTGERRIRLKEMDRDFRNSIDNRWKEVYPVKAGIMYYHNANAVRERYLAAWQRGMQRGSAWPSQDGWPRFHAFRDVDWHFTWQFSGGISKDKLFSGSASRLQIKSYNEAAYDDAGLNQRQKRKQTRSVVTALIGGEPVEFHVQFHRPLPEGSIKRASIVRRKHGFNSEWSLLLFVDLSHKNEVVVSDQQNPAGIVALELGFMMIDGRMRIGIYGDGLSPEHPLWLPDKDVLKMHKQGNKTGKHYREVGVLTAFKHIEHVQREKDRLFEIAKKSVVEKIPSDLSPELKAGLEKGRQGNLIKILNWAKKEGHFLADELERWLANNNRLLTEMAGLRKKASRRRELFFYETAHELCRKYAVIVIKKTDFSKLARKEKSDGTSKELKNEARENRIIAANGEFVRILKYVAGKYHTTIDEREQQDKTATCHVCGHLNQFDVQVKLKLMLTCEACGNTWDQDINVIRNLLKEAQDSLVAM